MKLPAPAIQPVNETLYRVYARYELPGAGGWALIIQPGFTFDGASIPRFFWRVIGHPFTGLTVPAALVHDALYATHRLPKHVADVLFRNLLIQNGVPPWRAKTMYQAVDRFGGKAYNRPTASQLAAARRRVTIVNPQQVEVFPCASAFAPLQSC